MNRVLFPPALAALPAQPLRAVVARVAVAENLDAKIADQCFMAGLLHDAVSR